MYKDILLPVDLNHPSSWEKALPVAIAHGQVFGARLHLCTVVPDFGLAMVDQFFPKNFERQVLDETHTALCRFAEEHLPADCHAGTIVAHGTVYEEILAAADRVNADLIVMASHRPELKDYLLGPNAARVVRHFARSVLVVR